MPDNISILVISSVGYTVQEVNIAGSNVANVTLVPNNSDLNEIVVVVMALFVKRPYRCRGLCESQRF
ncbi:hypothetical protein [Paraflavitalea speifideaquila]|uniref:hypothetical protein n=1 Tax=Paraflavitalea speifideaquila TaxID=3076558 RepID=UPI0028EA9F88|nr:hypothetical protein [Paraflavitalea speifideiaquila]